MAERKQLQFKVVGEDPRSAVAPMFCNFVGISHVGREVQLEFIFLDINQIAQHMESDKSTPPAVDAPTFEGKTVAKVVIPSWAFLQLKGHMLGVFEKVEIEESRSTEEKGQERAYGV
jgi:hypothetical protein